jgi:hypothetical protein
MLSCLILGWVTGAGIEQYAGLIASQRVRGLGGVQGHRLLVVLAVQPIHLRMRSMGRGDGRLDKPGHSGRSRRNPP